MRAEVTFSGAAKDAVDEGAEKGVDAANNIIDEAAIAAAAAAAGPDDDDPEKKAEIQANLKVKQLLEQADRAMKLFFVYGNIGLAYWALYEYFWVAPFPQGDFVRCQLVYVVAAPLYKPLALSMWASLMAVVQFAFCFRHSEKQPGKKENGNYAGVYPGESPLDDCNLAWFAAFLVMLPYVVWGVVAFVICIPLVLIFFPLPLIVMGLAPAVVTYIPTYLLGNVKERVGGIVMIVPTVALGIVVKPLCLYIEHCSVMSDWPCFEQLYDFWEDECLDRVKKIFSSQQQTEAHATLMLKVFAVQVRKRMSARDRER